MTMMVENTFTLTGAERPLIPAANGQQTPAPMQ
jgi:hypothetical protein